MKKNIIVLDTPFKINDVVEPVLNDFYDSDETIFFNVVGYEILSVNESGEVTSYSVRVQSQMSEILYYLPANLRLKSKSD